MVKSVLKIDGHAMRARAPRRMKSNPFTNRPTNSDHLVNIHIDERSIQLVTNAKKVLCYSAPKTVCPLSRCSLKPFYLFFVQVVWLSRREPKRFPFPMPGGPPRKASPTPSRVNPPPSAQALSHNSKQRQATRQGWLAGSTKCLAARTRKLCWLGFDVAATKRTQSGRSRLCCRPGPGMIDSN